MSDELHHAVGGAWGQYAHLHAWQVVVLAHVAHKACRGAQPSSGPACGDMCMSHSAHPSACRTPTECKVSRQHAVKQSSSAEAPEEVDACACSAEHWSIAPAAAQRPDSAPSAVDRLLSAQQVALPSAVRLAGCMQQHRCQLGAIARADSNGRVSNLRCMLSILRSLAQLQ